MERDFAGSTGLIDKNKVLDIKPLRCLVPIFPWQPSPSAFPNGFPFMYAAPTGPFPSGFVPFYPFNRPATENSPERSSHTPVEAPRSTPHFEPASSTFPLNACKAPSSSAAAAAATTLDAVIRNSNSRPTTKKRSRLSRKHLSPSKIEDLYKNGFAIVVAGSGDDNSKIQNRDKKANRTVHNVVIECEIANILQKHGAGRLGPKRQDGDRESVELILTLYDDLRKRLGHLEETSEDPASQSKRHDLRSAALLMSKGIRTNQRRRFGTVPGVEVGDVFYFRMEMCLVGLHSQSMAGIDYTTVKTGDQNEDEPLAVSIVSSGAYDDGDNDDGDILYYSGHGGGGGASDQKLVRGNLALERSLHRGNDVRVIRGFKDEVSTGGKVYVYDGLYKIEESWTEKGKSGCSVFKYKLVRVPGQSPAFTVWKKIQQWGLKGELQSRAGVILPDLTSGVEKLPVCLMNEMDDEKGPACFDYQPTLKNTRNLGLKEEAVPGCDCRYGCVLCSCVKKNGGSLPYAGNGVLVSPAIVHECGPLCTCPSNCRNRVSQGGIKLRLEVFRTKDMGWGLRSWDPIRAGSFICEYAGEVVGPPCEGRGDGEFSFDSRRAYIAAAGSGERRVWPFAVVISAGRVGNVARFMNHGCSPNVFWRPVHRGSTRAVAFFALKHIPPMVELAFDYGVVETNTAQKRKRDCLCRSPECKGFFFS